MIILLLVVILAILICYCTIEKFNEGTYYKLYPNNSIETNLSRYLYSDRIGNDNYNSRYYNHNHNIDMRIVPLYKGKNWIATKFPSYIYPSWSQTQFQMFSNDSKHIWK